MADPAVRIVLLGMRCGFTEAVLAALADRQIDLRAVVLPGSDPGDPVSGIAAARGVPVLPVPDRSTLRTAAFREVVAAAAPSLVVVACFPWRLPASLRAVPAHGCLNIHPSLLPDGRGPEPVFWTFRRDERETGVTVHRLDDSLDTGPILAQERVGIPGDATIASLERELAQLGATLLLDHFPALLGGSAHYAPQGAPAWAAPHPDPGDLLVPTAWPVARAARYIAAVAGTWGPVPVLIEGTGQRLAVREVEAVEPGNAAQPPLRIAGERAWIRFAGGVLACRLATTQWPLSLR